MKFFGWDEVFLVVKNSEGFYLDGGDMWMPIERAWSYTSTVVFMDAENHKAKVYLHLPSGREIQVFPEDFSKGES